MNLLNYFRTSKKSSAKTAKERLQIIVAHERGARNQPDFLPEMQEEIMAVIRKYVDISDEMVKVQLDNDNDLSVLELNVTLPNDNH